jgi:hypothetical protein
VVRFNLILIVYSYYREYGKRFPEFGDRAVYFGAVEGRFGC